MRPGPRRGEGHLVPRNWLFLKKKNFPMVLCLYFLNIYLFGCAESQLQRAGSSSPARDRTRAPHWEHGVRQTTGLSPQFSPPPQPGESSAPRPALGPARQRYLSCSWTRWPQFRDFTWFWTASAIVALVIQAARG